jgi:glycosyltransferase involved in cell wall biosynthesis
MLLVRAGVRGLPSSLVRQLPWRTVHHRIQGQLALPAEILGLRELPVEPLPSLGAQLQELHATLTDLLAKLPPDQPRLPILLTGSTPLLGRIVTGLLRAGRRRQLALVLQLEGDHLPLARSRANLLRVVDHVVVESTLAARAVAECGASANPACAPCVTVIPPAVDRTLFQPLPPGDRQALRRTAHGLGDGDRLVVSVITDRVILMAVHVMLIIRHLRHGEAVVCSACGQATLFRIVPEELTWVAPACCGRCGARQVTRITPRPEVRLGLHVAPDLPAPVTRALIEILEGEARRLGLGKQVMITGPEPDALPGLLAAADVHLPGHDGPGIPPGLMEAAATCVPTVCGDLGAVRELRGPGFHPVPTLQSAVTSAGYLRAPIDPASALLRLDRLLGEARVEGRQPDPSVRDWPDVVGSWTGLLEGLATTPGTSQTVLGILWQWAALAPGSETSCEPQ